MAFEDFAQVLQESFDASASALKVTGNLLSVAEVGISGWTVPAPIAISGTSLTASIANQLAISSVVPVGISGIASASVTNFPSTQGVSGGVSATIVNAGTAVTVKQLSVQATSSDIGLMTNSIIHGLTTGGGGGYVDVKVNPSGALTVDSSGSNVAITSLPLVGISGTTSISGSALTATIAGTASVNITNSLAISGTAAVSGNLNLYTVLGYASSSVLTSPTSIQSSTGIIQTIGTIPANVKSVRIADTVGNFLAVYIGATASPAFVVEPGMSGQIPYLNAASAAVSARYLENVAPTAGYTLIEWLG